MITASTHGAPNWVDLATTDIEGATRFYRELLGWRIEKSETPTGDYYMGFIAQQQVAGMMASPDVQMAVWTVFFNVDDVDEMASAIEAAGGKIVQPPFDIPEARIAIAADPAGAMFGLFQGPLIEGTWFTREPGGVSWVETMNRDTAAAEAFYATIFGWKAETEAVEGRAYTTFTLDGEMVAGMLAMPDDMDASVPAHWGLYFNVLDCHDAASRIEQLGGRVLRPVEQLEMGRFTVVADPQGAVFQLMDYVT